MPLSQHGRQTNQTRRRRRSRGKISAQNCNMKLINKNDKHIFYMYLIVCVLYLVPCSCVSLYLNLGLYHLAASAARRIAINCLSLALCHHNWHLLIVFSSADQNWKFLNKYAYCCCWHKRRLFMKLSVILFSMLFLCFFFYYLLRPVD